MDFFQSICTSVLYDPWLVESVDVEPWIQRANYKVTQFFNCTPKPHVVQESTAFVILTRTFQRRDKNTLSDEGTEALKVTEAKYLHAHSVVQSTNDSFLSFFSFKEFFGVEGIPVSNTGMPRGGRYKPKTVNPNAVSC